MRTSEEVTTRRDEVIKEIRGCRNSLFLPGLRKQLETLNWVLGEIETISRK